MCGALILDRSDPCWLHRSRTRAAFATDDYPVDPPETDWPEVFQKRFDAQKADGCWRALEMADAWNAVLLVFDAHTPPNVRRLRSGVEFCGEELFKPIGAFGQDLVRVPVGLKHNVHDGVDVVVWNGVLEEITHAIDEDGFRRCPPEWLNKLFGNKAGSKPKFIGVSRDTTKPLSEGFGVAVLATGADLLTPANGVPRSLGPFDFELQAH